MSSSTFAPPLSAIADDGQMSDAHPRAGGPARRRSFTPEQKLAHLAAYEQACQEQQGGAYLRREGLYLSLIHISEPTRPERISYAVFCLKKKK